ncbi:34326_t:CDS:2, partial [Racocetra persica]
WAMGKFSRNQIRKEIESIKKKYKRSGRKNVPQWVHDDRLSCSAGTIIEYQEMAPLFAWLNNHTEIRSDAFKYLVTLKRPVGFLAQDIGMWEYILNIMALMAVLTNAIILAFHSTWMKQQFQNYISNPDDEDQL